MIKKFYTQLLDMYEHSDWMVVWSNAIAIVFGFFILTLWRLNAGRLPEEIPLFYSLPWGDEQLINNSQFIILPAIVLLACLTNLFISWQLHPSQKILKRILALSTTILALLLLITTIRIVNIFI